MTKPTKRKLTDADRVEIQNLWHEYQTLRRMAKSTRQESDGDAWLRAAAERRMLEISVRLDIIFEATAP